MTIASRIFPDYHAALRVCYEEEISGEAYFTSLAAHFPGRHRDALLMMARMERITAAALRVLIARHDIKPASHDSLIDRGGQDAARQQGISWDSLTRAMAEEYPAYVDEFEQLEKLAPAADQAPIAIAVQHEHALIAFARREVAVDPKSLEPMLLFLAEHDA